MSMLVKVYAMIFNVTMLQSLPYSRKYWWELNLAVGSKIDISNVLANLNLAIQ